MQYDANSRLSCSRTARCVLGQPSCPSSVCLLASGTRVSLGSNLDADMHCFVLGLTVYSSDGYFGTAWTVALNAKNWMKLLGMLKACRFDCIVLFTQLLV